MIPLIGHDGTYEVLIGFQRSLDATKKHTYSKAQSSQCTRGKYVVVCKTNTGKLTWTNRTNPTRSSRWPVSSAILTTANEISIINYYQSRPDVCGFGQIRWECRGTDAGCTSLHEFQIDPYDLTCTCVPIKNNSRYITFCTSNETRTSKLDMPRVLIYHVFVRARA